VYKTRRRALRVPLQALRAHPGCPFRRVSTESVSFLRTMRIESEALFEKPRSVATGQRPSSTTGFFTVAFVVLAVRRAIFPPRPMSLTTTPRAPFAGTAGRASVITAVVSLARAAREGSVGGGRGVISRLLHDASSLAIGTLAAFRAGLISNTSSTLRKSLHAMDDFLFLLVVGWQASGSNSYFCGRWF